MSQANKMICPDCGVEMNYHAEKIDYTAAIEDPALIDPPDLALIASAGGRKTLDGYQSKNH